MNGLTRGSTRTTVSGKGQHRNQIDVSMQTQQIGAVPGRVRTNVGLDALRVAAALLVVVGHSRYLMWPQMEAEASSYVAGGTRLFTSLGHQAVLVFFALSGYWVGGSVSRQVRAGKFFWGAYLVRRFSRLYVVLLPALLLTGVMDALLVNLFGDTGVATGASAYANVATPGISGRMDWRDFLANLVFLQGLRAQTFGSNGALWSLAFEALYYLLFPAMLLMVRADSRNRRIGAFVIVGIVLLVGGFPLISLIPAWLLGALAALVRHTEPGIARGISPKWSEAMLGPLGLVMWSLVLVSVMVGCRALPLPDAVESFAIGLATFPILLGCQRRDVASELPGALPRVVTASSAFSYSLYAVHLPLLMLGAAVAEKYAVQGAGAIVVGVVSSMIVAYVFAWVTERRTELVAEVLTRRLGVNR